MLQAPLQHRRSCAVCGNARWAHHVSWSCAILRHQPFHSSSCIAITSSFHVCHTVLQSIKARSVRNDLAIRLGIVQLLHMAASDKATKFIGLGCAVGTVHQRQRHAYGLSSHHLRANLRGAGKFVAEGGCLCHWHLSEKYCIPCLQCHSVKSLIT